MNYCPICDIRLDTPLDFQMHICSKGDKERALKRAQEAEESMNSLSLEVRTEKVGSEVPVEVE